MKIPLSWLREYVDIDIPTSELAIRLTLAGLEVETIEQIGETWDREKIVVGQIVEVKVHPHADRLCLAVVEYGAGEPLTVVTGAPNVKVYETEMPPHPLKIAFATVGARLVDGHTQDGSTLKLKASKIRGIRSEGMVCSEKELGLSDEHEGILYLPDDAPVGTPLVDYMGDQVLEFDIKGAFGHLQSVIGIAREIAALLGKPLRRDMLQVAETQRVSRSEETDAFELKIPDPDLCARYTGAMIRGVQVGPSPFWMQQRLMRTGMRPINNIVDITNYVMLELGQPLHAFDYRNLRPRPGSDKPAIIIRRARQGETITTLDGETRDLDSEMLLITDGGGPVAVAGVMGGLESEVGQQTTDVLLESANFHFLNNRRTSQKLGLSSEASTRFGKRIPPELSIRAAARAAWLMAELAGGTVETTFGDLYPVRQRQIEITLPLSQIRRTLGIDVAVKESVRILESLEFKVQVHPDRLHVVIPDYRLDINIPEDLVEEIGRIYGYDRFPRTLIGDKMPPQRRNLRLEGAERVRDLLTRCGLDEVITYSIVDAQDDDKLLPTGAAQDYVVIRNPITSERTHMRRQLLPSLLNTARSNLRFVERVAIFEIARVYHPRPGKALPDEPRRLCIVMTGPREEGSWLEGQDRTTIDFYDLKGVVEALCAGLNAPHVEWKPGDSPAYHPGRCAQVRIIPTDDVSRDGVLGPMGELHPTVRAAFELPDQPVCALEFDLDALLSSWSETTKAQMPSVHPPVYEDLAIVVDEQVPASQVRQLIVQAGGRILRKVELFDVYRGEQIGKGKKSLAYALTYQADDKTLNAKAAASLRARIVKRLERELGATLRS